MRLDPPAVRFAPPAAWLGGWNAPGGWFALGDGNPRLAAATAGPPKKAASKHSTTPILNTFVDRLIIITLYA